MRKHWPSVKCLWMPRSKQALCRKTYNSHTRELRFVNCPACLKIVESYRR